MQDVFPCESVETLFQNKNAYFSGTDYSGSSEMHEDKHGNNLTIQMIVLLGSELQVDWPQSFIHSEYCPLTIYLLMGEQQCLHTLPVQSLVSL